MSRHTFRLGALIVSGVVAATSLQARDLRVLSSFDTSQLPTYSVLQQFMDNVAEISGGETTFTVFGPEAVSIFEQLEPVSNGVFDALYTHPVFHAGDGGLALAVDAIDVDPIARRASGVWDSVDAYYQQTHNLKMVAMMSVSTAGYHLFTKEPVSENGDLAGRKVRGTPTYFGVIEALGAEPVVLPGSEIYSALQTGIVDGAGWPAAGMVSMKHFEVANYRLRPTFGTATQPVFINLDVWNGLEPEIQADLLEAGRITELEMPWIGDQIQADEDAKLEELGVAVTTLSPEMAEKVQLAFVESIWKLGEDSAGEAATALRAQAIAAGLTE